MPPPIAGGKRSDKNTRGGAEEAEMNTRRSRRIRRGTAEQLLQGAPVPTPEPLTRLLASAAAPPQPGELAREEAAVARSGPPAAGHLSGRATRRPAAMRAGTRGAAAIPVAALCATLTFDVHAILTSPPGHGRHSRASAGRHHVNAGQRTRGTAGQRGDTGQRGSSGVGQPGLPARDRAQALASPALLRVLAHPGFPRLTATAAGAANVADLCALALRLPALPAPQRLASLPATALAVVPVASLVSLPRRELAHLPGPALARLPARILARLPRPV